MAHPKLLVPTTAALEAIERAQGFVWPDAFRAFCRAQEGADARAAYPKLRGRFLTTPADWHVGFEGIEEDPRLVPFYVEHERGQLADYYVFAIAAPFTKEGAADRVLVWSVHTVVHDWPSLDAWLAENKAKTP